LAYERLGGSDLCLLGGDVRPHLERHGRIDVAFIDFRSWSFAMLQVEPQVTLLRGVVGAQKAGCGGMMRNRHTKL
jgi:hypothetical protein